jgi:hypothetical protein
MYPYVPSRNKNQATHVRAWYRIMSFITCTFLFITPLAQHQCSSKSFEHPPKVGTQELQNLRRQWCPSHVESYVHHRIPLERKIGQHLWRNKWRIWQKHMSQNVKIIMNMCANKPPETTSFLVYVAIQIIAIKKWRNYALEENNIGLICILREVHNKFSTMLELCQSETLT